MLGARIAHGPPLATTAEGQEPSGFQPRVGTTLGSRQVAGHPLKGTPENYGTQASSLRRQAGFQPAGPCNPGRMPGCQFRLEA